MAEEIHKAIASDKAEDSGWQPIATAPKDGVTEILGCQTFEDGTARRVTMIWAEKGGVWSWRANVHSYIAFEPQFYQPIPAPPQEPTQ